MEHIIISPGKLKLTLTKNDMDKYALTNEILDDEGAVTRQSFRQLLDDVKQISGFDAQGDRVFIQLYPSRDGGAEIYITRLTIRRDQLPEQTNMIRITRVCAFDDMQTMLTACSKLPAQPGGSSAWCGDGKYYLITEDAMTYRDAIHRKISDKFRIFLGEYGKIIDDPTAIYYVKEHCFCFCEKNAVKILGSMV